MSMRDLIDPDCGGANPLMRLGNQIVHDVAHKDEGISGRPMPFAEASSRSQQGFGQMSQDQLVNEYLGQMSAPPPQTFRMDALLQEMREIDAQNYAGEVVQAPPVSAEVHNDLSWAKEFREVRGSTSISHVRENVEVAAAPLQQNNEEQVRRCFFLFDSQNANHTEFIQSFYFLCVFFFSLGILGSSGKVINIT